MSRADTAPRILEAAATLGADAGVAALSLQGVATAAGVSKALVLYHFEGKDQLLTALAERLVAEDVGALDAAAAAADPFEAWRDVAGDVARRARRALLVSLLHDAALRARAPELAAPRYLAAGRLAAALLQAASLRPRIAPALVGRVLLHQLDGVAVSPATASELTADLDASALALLGLGR